ncbi:3482_t:CDS:2, partial [Gigaspora rosea]
AQNLFAELPEDWKSEYLSKEWINEEWYKKLAKKDTTLGIFSISYTIICQSNKKIFEVAKQGSKF